MSRKMGPVKTGVAFGVRYCVHMSPVIELKAFALGSGTYKD
jgi:hypothetical protein